MSASPPGGVLRSTARHSSRFRTQQVRRTFLSFRSSWRRCSYRALHLSELCASHHRRGLLAQGQANLCRPIPRRSDKAFNATCEDAGALALSLRVMRVLGISGSLRAASINSALLRAAVRLAPSEVALTIFPGVGELPLFNPDLEARLPSQVGALHAAVAASDALLFASPEYAHGVTGSIKNTLDWLVSFEPFVCKPVAIINASPRAHHADAALRETLKTMSAVIVEPASISIPLLGAGLTEEAMTYDPVVSSAIRSSLVALHEAVVHGQFGQGPASPFP